GERDHALLPARRAALRARDAERVHLRVARGVALHGVRRLLRPRELALRPGYARLRLVDDDVTVVFLGDALDGRVDVAGQHEVARVPSPNGGILVVREHDGRGAGRVRALADVGGRSGGAGAVVDLLVDRAEDVLVPLLAPAGDVVHGPSP